MKTNEEILANPQIGDITHGKYLNYRGCSRYAKYMWIECNSCKIPHWVRDNKRDKAVLHCYLCAPHTRTRPIQMYRPGVIRMYRPDAIGKYKTITVSEIPKEGDLIRGGEIGRNDLSLFRWTRCPRCGKCRWIFRGTRGNPMCPSCGNEYKMGKYIGEKSGHWKGGRLYSRKGYVEVIMREENPYYRMANQDRYVSEHRLVMAQYLGRCIEKWEVVHHRNGIKNDNRIENLELIESKNAHNSITGMQSEIERLHKRIGQLEKKVKLNEWRIKELETTHEEVSDNIC